MSSNPFQAFIDLITFDKSVLELERSIKEKQATIATIEQSIAAIDKKLEASKASYTQARKSVDQQELIMKEFNQTESDYKKKLDGVQNQKEYKAITTELETVQAKQQEQEVVLLGAWNTVEQVQKAHKVKEQEFKSQQAELQIQLKEQTDTLEAERKDLSTKEQERNKKTTGVNAEWLEKYGAMRSRVSNPVVPVENAVCTACFLSIPSQMMADLRHNKMLQCKQCFRFLYLEKAETQPETETKHAE